jgi:cytochrome c-type biogenesis protein CcsB
MRGLIFLLLIFSAVANAGVGEPLKKIPVQDGGRIKPFDTFARETLQLVYGKKTYQGKEAVDIVLTWMIIPDLWLSTPIVEVRNIGLREALKITSKEIYFTPSELFANTRLPLIIQELKTLRDRQEKLNPYYSAVQHLEAQLGTFQMIRAGEGIRVVPATPAWLPVARLDGPPKDAFIKLTQEYVKVVTDLQSEKKVDTTALQGAVEEFINRARAVDPAHYASPQRIAIEVMYNNVHPFKWAWICYLICALSLVASIVSGRTAYNRLAWSGLIAGILLHALGMGIRIYLAGRPPVSNMYETVVWVPFGVIGFSILIGRLQKSKLPVLCASVVAIVCLILTDLSPTVLDGNIQPLEPVLRSTFWLSTHVLIITLGYAAFFLAFALGDLMMFYYLKDESGYASEIKQGTQSIYKTIQIGVVLLATGTILGGVWADYSWGRFWGWDPKETWALIALLGYLALLHGRLVGWVKNFELSVFAVVTFSLVMMSWYGVNFVLGAGLHSYGFGAGGVEYVTAFVILHLLFVAYVSTVRYGRLKKK